MVTDDELMVAAGQGDRIAFAEIVNRHNAKVYRLASRFLGNRQEATDVAQDAFLRILAAAPDYRPGAAFGTYLFRVVSNLCLDALRKRRRAQGEELQDPKSGDLSAEEEFLRNERAVAVSVALFSLPPRQRLAVLLKYYEDLNYREIAEVLKTSQKGVERLLARARSALLSSLKDL